MSDFHEIRSAASSEPAADGTTKRTYQCLELSDVTLFVWERSGVATHVQMLMGEQYVEWSVEQGLQGGHLYREREGFGVRSLRPESNFAAQVQRAERILERYALPEGREGELLEHFRSEPSAPT